MTTSTRAVHLTNTALGITSHLFVIRRRLYPFALRRRELSGDKLGTPAFGAFLPYPGRMRSEQRGSCDA